MYYFTVKHTIFYVNCQNNLDRTLERDRLKDEIKKLRSNYERLSQDSTSQTAALGPIVQYSQGQDKVLAEQLMEMMLIPSGEFQMGSNKGPSKKKLTHTIFVDPFYIDKYEVTNEQYKIFVDVNPEWRKDRILQEYCDGNYLKEWNGNHYPQGKDDHPVIHVSWYGAMAYAQWVGKRLPTEAEWEKAARGGLVGQKYPWGNLINSRKANYKNDIGGTTPVGRYPANGYGLYDMVGNVWEWCLDAWDASFYTNSSRRNPIAGPDNITDVVNNYMSVKNKRVLRGGSWGNTSKVVQVAYRSGYLPARTSASFGFRCVRDATPLSLRNEFVQLVDTFKTVFPKITTEQRIELLKRGVQEYGLVFEDVRQMLMTQASVVDENANYFALLGLSVENIQNQSEDTIIKRVDAAYKNLSSICSTSLKANDCIGRSNKAEDQWQYILNQAKGTLKDRQRQCEHLTTFYTDEDCTKISRDIIPGSADEFQNIEPMLFRGTASADMVLIPAGDFQMGSNENRTDEKPRHPVSVDAFYMDKCEVTNAQYKEFLDANPKWRKDQVDRRFHNGYYLGNWNGNSYPSEKADHPVCYVSWYAAMAYAEWVGKRLPTEAEWEKAAQGRMVGKKYPWGDLIDSSKANYGKNVGETTPVGTYPPNGYGLYDMVGNVWEWCLDAWDEDFYVSSPLRNPIAGADDVLSVINNFMSIKKPRVLRGGSWLITSQSLRLSYRNRYAPTASFDFGFRCVRDVTP